MLVLLIILKILLYILLFFAGLLLLLLVIPFHYSGRVLTADGFRMQLALGWAWRLLMINADIEGENKDIALSIMNKRVYRLNSKAFEEEEEQPEQAEKGKKERKERRGLNLRNLSDKALMNELFKYFKRVLDIAKPKYLHLYGTYGFDDPSLTGIACGITGIIKGLIPQAKLHLMPDFTREVMELDLRVEGSLTAGSLAYQTIRTAFKKPVRKIWSKKKKI